MTVKLVLHVETREGYFRLERDAPALPQGVSWHAEMSLVVDDDDCGLGVSEIKVFYDGRVEAWINLVPDVPRPELLLRDFVDAGWCVRTPITID